MSVADSTGVHSLRVDMRKSEKIEALINSICPYCHESKLELKLGERRSFYKSKSTIRCRKCGFEERLGVLLRKIHSKDDISPVLEDSAKNLFYTYQCLVVQALEHLLKKIADKETNTSTFEEYVYQLGNIGGVMSDEILMIRLYRKHHNTDLWSDQIFERNLKTLFSERGLPKVLRPPPRF